MSKARLAGSAALAAAIALSIGTPVLSWAEGGDVEAPGAAVSADVSRTAGELTVSDNYPDLDGWLEGIGSNTVVKINCTTVGAGQTVLPRQVTGLYGWDGGFLGSNTEKVRQIGYGGSDSFTFEGGSNVTVGSIEFNLADGKLVIPEGATVVFRNCSFSGTVVNRGNATFQDCAFDNGKIEDYAGASYTGSTEKPENLVTPASQFESLGLVVPAECQQLEAVHGVPFSQDVELQLSGTNADDAEMQVSVEPAESGIEAKVEGTTLKLSGTPAQAGTVAVEVTAEAPAEDAGQTETATASLQITVNERISASLEGELDCVTAGQGDYYDTLDVFVVAEDGTKTDYHDYALANPDAKIEVDISPSGSGMTANWLYDTLAVGGTAETAGVYQVSVSITDKGQTAKSNAVELRVYSGNETLAGQFENIDGQPESWDMEPYEIWKSDNAVVPTWLHHIYGSHESGLYGQIGNADDAYGSDTLTIPAGADVTLENVKINSSVKIAVEAGGELTLTDSVVYGPVEVNGGTLTVTPDDVRHSGICGTITLNDGSTLSSSQVISNNGWLDDGGEVTEAESVVVVNGTVTFEGDNTIQGSTGNGQDKGQTGLVVNGTAVIPEGSTLTVVGGGRQNDTLYAAGGTGIELNGGTITGDGKLVVQGGEGIDADGGKGIAGTGTISVDDVTVTGGRADRGPLDVDTEGGAAGEQGVTVIPGSRFVATGGVGNDGVQAEGTDSFSIAAGGEDPESPSDEDQGEVEGGGSAEQPADTDSGEGVADGKSDNDGGNLPDTSDKAAPGITGALVAAAASGGLGLALRRREQGE